jgi:alkylation response protein AidB-like acyl-CoA dehydrogenase
MDQFFQQPPLFAHPLNDPLLKDCLGHWVDDISERELILKDLELFSERIVEEIEELGHLAESNPPEHIPYDAWGNRVDDVQVHPAWYELQDIAAEEGLIALGHDRKRQYGRLHQFSKLYLFHPSSAFFTCPLAMTDGAATLIEHHNCDELKHAFDHITSTDPLEFWTSGQWMTERSGGSDVGASETLAKNENGVWKLYGTKWFTSATTGEMAMTLARIVDDEGKITEGSRGLSLFYLELRDDQGNLQNIKVNRLKNKLGTKALPTAELELTGTPAILLGEEGKGVKNISSLFNITRIYNACTTVGAFRRLLSLAHDYADKRVAFARPLAQLPLHARLLQELEEEFSGCFLLTFFTIHLLGRSEFCKDQYSEGLLRLLTPVAKLYTAKVNINATTELIESFGGAGYIEDTGLPRWLRDAQVFPIWEGTTNVLALDTLRAIQREEAFQYFQQQLDQWSQGLSESSSKTFQETLDWLGLAWKKFFQSSPEELQYQARNFAFSLAHISIAFLAEELAQKTGSEHYKKIGQRFLKKSLADWDILF